MQRNSGRLTMHDCTSAGHCPSGVRRWIHDKGFDFRDFMKNGIDLATIEAMHDGYGDQIIARKRAREAAGGD